MKAFQASSSLLIVILVVMPVFNLPLNVLAAHQDDTAATLRGNAVVGQEERILGKGGNGGGGGGNGGGGKNNETPAPTSAPTKASTPTPPTPPPPTPGYPSVDPASCEKAGFTRQPTTPSPSPTPPTAPKCVNPGTCSNKGPYCCDGWTCSKGKNGVCVAARRNLRVEQEAKSFPFQTSAADARHRKLDQCTDPNKDSCNVNDNPLVCPPDIPSNVGNLESVICNYEDGSYKATVDRCDSNSNYCCEDGAGGYYYPVGGCWGTNVQCCPKGYTKNANGNLCIPMNCCDGDKDHRDLYCPNNCKGI